MRLLCPNCRKTIDAYEFRGRTPGIIYNVSCLNCGKQVNAVEIVEEKKEGEKTELADSEIEPTEKDKELADLLIRMIPAGEALAVIKDAPKLAKLIAFRLIVFGIVFFATQSSFAVDIKNPYFLVFLSTISLIALHVVLLIPRSVILDRASWVEYWVICLFALIPALLVISEILLIYYYFWSFLIDVIVTLVAVKIIGKKAKI